MTPSAASTSRPIRVKFLSKANKSEEASRQWLRHFPGQTGRLGSCQFIFDPAARDYDWLVVYDELPAGWTEPLACPREHTLLLTVEPSSIKAYGRAYVRQFGHVLTSQEPWAIRHPNVIREQPGLVNFYGQQSPHGTYDALASAEPPTSRPGLIATVCSSKRMGHTLHAARYDFTQALKARLPELEIFGHGVRPMTDKAESIDPFPYHIAVENHVAPHHWTEKLSDPFLGHSLPFYFGAPNAADYFPADSFIPIDIFDVAGAARIIKAAIANDEYHRRLPAIREARSLVLKKYGTFPNLVRLIEERTSTSLTNSSAATSLKDAEFIFARHVLRRRRPFSALGDFYDKIHHRLRGVRMGRRSIVSACR